MRARTVAISGVVIALIAASIFVAWGASVSADDKKPELVFVLGIHVDKPDGVNGESCSVQIPGWMLVPRVVVRNERDEIVALERFTVAVNGQWSKPIDTQTLGLDCSYGEYRMSLPDASFYQVFVDGELYAIYSHSDLPNDTMPIAVQFD